MEAETGGVLMRLQIGSFTLSLGPADPVKMILGSALVNSIDWDGLKDHLKDNGFSGNNAAKAVEYAQGYLTAQIIRL